MAAPGGTSVASSDSSSELERRFSSANSAWHPINAWHCVELQICTRDVPFDLQTAALLVFRASTVTYF